MRDAMEVNVGAILSFMITLLLVLGGANLHAGT